MAKQKETAEVRRERLAKEYKEKISRENKALFDSLREQVAKAEKEIEEANKARPNVPEHEQQKDQGQQ